MRSLLKIFSSFALLLAIDYVKAQDSQTSVTSLFDETKCVPSGNNPDSSVFLCKNDLEGHIQELASLYNEHICPPNYHICNVEDTNLITQSMYDMNDDCYATAISTYEDDCNDCLGNSLKNENMVVVGQCNPERLREQYTHSMNNVDSIDVNSLPRRNLALSETQNDAIVSITQNSDCCIRIHTMMELLQCYEGENTNIYTNLGVECGLYEFNNVMYRLCGVENSLLNVDCNYGFSNFPECARGSLFPLNMCNFTMAGNGTSGGEPSMTPTPSGIPHELPSMSMSPFPLPSNKPTNPATPSSVSSSTSRFTLTPTPTTTSSSSPVRELPSMSSKPTEMPSKSPVNDGSGGSGAVSSVTPTMSPVRELPSMSSKPTELPSNSPVNNGDGGNSAVLSVTPTKTPVRELPSMSSKPTEMPSHLPVNNGGGDNSAVSTKSMTPFPSRPPTNNGGDDGAVSIKSMTPFPSRPPTNNGGDNSAVSTKSMTPFPSRPPTNNGGDDGVVSTKSMTPFPSRPPTNNGGDDGAVSTKSMTPRPTRPPTHNDDNNMKPTPSMTSRPKPIETQRPMFCILENGRYVPVGWRGMINNCIICECQDGAALGILKCKNRCEEDTVQPTKPPTSTTDQNGVIPSKSPKPNANDITSSIRDILSVSSQREKLSCVGVPYERLTNFRKHRCHKTRDLAGFACCRNPIQMPTIAHEDGTILPSNCEIDNCAMCDENKQCRVCEPNYILVRETSVKPYTTKCIQRPENIQTINSVISQIETGVLDVCEIQNTYAKLNERFEVECRECNNGVVSNNNICECNQGFVGEKCEVNCRRHLCSGHGECRISQSSQDLGCLCDTNWYGKSCDKYRNAQKECVFGMYNDRTNTCVCKYGYKGDLCNEKIECMFGDILDSQCVCKDGYSGRDCSIRRPLPPAQILENREKRTALEEKPCVMGIPSDSGCVCSLGWFGERCEESMCRNGLLNITSGMCECREGWFGERCDEHCYAPCSMNGDMCNENRVCECRQGWEGTRCEKKQITREQPSILEISSYEVKVETASMISRNVSLEVIECMDVACLPIVIDIVGSSSLENNRRQLETTNDETFYMELDKELVGLNHSVFVYLDDDFLRNYTFDSHIVEIKNPVPARYAFSTFETSYLEASVAGSSDTIDAPPNNDGNTGGGGNDDTTGGDDTTNDNDKDTTQTTSSNSVTEFLKNPFVAGSSGLVFVVGVVGVALMYRKYKQGQTKKEKERTIDEIRNVVRSEIQSNNPLHAGRTASVNLSRNNDVMHV